MSSASSVVLAGFVLLVLIAVPQAFLSSRKTIYPGFIMPTLFLGFSGYYLYRDLYIYKPYPSMQEGMFMTLGLIGFGISAVTLVVCRLVAARRKQA